MKKSKPRVKSVVVLWASGPVQGRVEVRNGSLAGLKVSPGSASVSRGSFRGKGAGAIRLRVGVAGVRAARGADPTLVTIRTKRDTFSFLLRDVYEESPIWIPEYGVAVTSNKDTRDYSEIAETIRLRGSVSELERIQADPEESYEAACLNNRDAMCPTWLGTGRDMRIFRVGYAPEQGYWGYVEPWYHSKRAWTVGEGTSASPEEHPEALSFCVGRGASCEVKISRRLEDGVLPILTSVQEEGDVSYQLTSFASLEKRTLTPGRVRGSDWRAAYANTGGNMYSKEDREALSDLLEREMFGREEETVCCIRVTAVNSGSVPRYAWFKALRGRWKKAPKKRRYVGRTGFSEGAGRVYGINRLDGAAMPDEEMAVLLQPGQTATLEMIVPHQPISNARARDLARLDFDAHLQACRRLWRKKLRSGARIEVPEAAVNERIQAGLLHCDLVALGKEPKGSALATIGWYAPIGSESSPIIQFFDSMGWHKLAERCIQFFLDRQRDDGFIQNFGGYQLETGGVLWTMGEHYRYTRDRKWLARVRPKMLKACEYLLRWRDRNKRRGLRGKGYGMQDGKVADPEDFFHSFMLNALSYVGIQRAGEMVTDIDPASGKRLAKEARAYRRDIRDSFLESMATSPVIPTGNGSWVPSCPPWAGYPGPLALYAGGGQWFTHGAFGARDSLIGALYLVVCEVLDASELAASFLNRSHQELFTVRNAGLSQPYYCRHDFIHLKRGEVKAFLKTYYNQFTALQDRETYTFWEHYFRASQHKTHEEGWFLMQTRWMLWLEEADTLRLLSAVPRRWLENGKQIKLDRVATHFGSLDLDVRSTADDGCIEADIRCAGKRRPRAVLLRLPHPTGRKPRAVEGGQYDPETETVRLSAFKGSGKVRLFF